MATYFNEYFGVDRDILDDYGAFNISIINDLPLFIDPFLLFHSSKPEYQALHTEILKYIRFLRDQVVAGRVNSDLVAAWFFFSEVRQNWLGFSLVGNGGSGLGVGFAKALRANLAELFADFGEEKITESSHVEKVCLVQSGVGRDNISDFSTNLIKHFLCEYTQAFALANIAPKKRRQVWVDKAVFNYATQSWSRRLYELPWLSRDQDFVLLTPKDILTREENWINRTDMIRDFESIPTAIPDSELRGQVFAYFESELAKHSEPDKEFSQRDRDEAAVKTLIRFPDLVDYYIRFKEENGDDAVDMSSERVLETRVVFEDYVRQLQRELANTTSFYTIAGGTYEETHQRLAYLKDVVENKGGHRIFWHDGKSIQRESDLPVLTRLVWFGSPSDVGAEANDGRGPVDYKISRGAFDKTLIEMKLAKNSALKRNLEKQLPIYQAASDAKQGIKAIIYFTLEEKIRVDAILDELKLASHKDVVLIDARADNKPSGSKA
ncbi:hypothetical protein C8D77_1011536 [Mesorhizobium loti]|uniref:Coiled-coil protein n=1 Tax=Rhizobium loti TaxID=381 RepID=A0A8E3B825_RHILI|nr:hypothetical protein [Mesorhizobium loti]PWJ94850.1 hypothetical protein C8D77_1011536 [Mesorhizobium loti]